jgi:hypothetical protein
MNKNILKLFTFIIAINTFSIERKNKTEDEKCSECSQKISDLKKENLELEAQCRHLRDEVGKWMKLYRDEISRSVEIEQKCLSQNVQYAKQCCECYSKYSH